MKRILCLGGAGLIGSNVVRELLAAGHEVVAVDNFSKYGYLTHDFYDHPTFGLEAKDVRSMYPAEFRGYDVVICLAGLNGGTRYFHRIPYRIARDNTQILSHAIDATVAAAPKALFVYFSAPLTEGTGSATNWGAQKRFGDAMVRGAHVEFGLPYLILRPFNPAGAGELPEIRCDGTADFGMAHVIPDFIYKSMIEQTPFEIFGDAEHALTFTHVRDVAKALVALVDSGAQNDEFDFCGTNAQTLGKLAQKIWTHVNGRPLAEIKPIPTVPAERCAFAAKPEKLHAVTGWSPRYDIDAIIDDSYHFVKSVLGR